MMAMAITRMDLTAAELRAAAAKSRDARAGRRMLALALVLEGADRTTAAETCGMDRQALRDWVHRHNAEELAGLAKPPSAAAAAAARCRPGRGARGLGGGGPRSGRDGVVRWRRRDLQRRIASALGWWSCTNSRLASDLWPGGGRGGGHRLARAWHGF